MLKTAFPQDIDEAIYSSLKGITVPDANGNPKVVPIQYIFPETEIVVEEFPSIVFYMVNFVPDLSRISNDNVYSNTQYDAQGNPISTDIKDDADPFIVNYDIRCYTTFEEDSKLLQKTLMTLFPFRGTLNINGVPFDMDFDKHIDLTKSQGQLNTSSMKILEKAPQRQQTVSLRYKVFTAFDVHKASTYKVVNSVIANTSTGG